ncbi:hypothetical protein LLEC1_01789 [Akanthomyces lecanii]|uniref:Uncharacterized protein n=1 Tax=Cordyceps confragosa TaxID=2714763 RepID=A0A179IGU9_CORDF|nr:hypothetical protein LLEC1_01789 [Akanthomyces lecanii]
MSGTDAINRAVQQGRTSKRTRNQFSVYLSSRHRLPRVSKKNVESATGLLEYAITALPAVSPIDKGQELAAAMQTAARHEPLDSPLRLQTNEVNPHLPNPTPSPAVTNANIADVTAQEPNEMYGGATQNAGAASVLRSFDYTDLTILSDDSDKEVVVDSPAVKAAVYNELLVSPEAGSSRNGFLDATKAERLSPPKQPRTGVLSTVVGARREVIIIESSDEEESSEEAVRPPRRRFTLAEASYGELSLEPHEVSAKGVCSTARAAPFYGNDNEGESAENVSTSETSASESHAARSTLENASFDVLTSKPPAKSVVDNRSPKSRQAATLVSSNDSSAESESSEDNIPLAALRKELSFRAPALVLPHELSEDDVPLATLRKQSASQMPTLVPQAVSEDTCSSTKTQTTLFVNSHKASADNELSEDNVPLSVLRKNRLGNKRRLSDDGETEFAIVYRPTSVVRRSTATRRETKVFNSDAFDAMIYRQSDTQPPSGVAIHPPTTASSTAPRRIFVHGNPAIHAPVVRTEKWLKDKAREIRNRPNRKRWFGKAAERMRWRYNKQVEEDKTKRQTQNKASAGRKTRQDPQPAGYKRVMDFGDVPRDRLPPYVLSDPAFVKGCDWMRKMRDEDVALWRAVEHRTQMTWQHYQGVLQEDD